VAREVTFEAGRGPPVEVDFRADFERLERETRAEPNRKPYKPIRPEWLPRRAWRA
jgi:hypothetical protein